MRFWRHVTGWFGATPMQASRAQCRSRDSNEGVAGRRKGSPSSWKPETLSQDAACFRAGFVSALVSTSTMARASVASLGKVRHTSIPKWIGGSMEVRPCVRLALVGLEGHLVEVQVDVAHVVLPNFLKAGAQHQHRRVSKGLTPGVARRN